MASKGAVCLLKVLAVLVSVALMLSASNAALGDQPLTQLADQEFLFEYDASVVPTPRMTGVTMDETGIMFVTWNDGIMRVPPAATTNVATNVGEYQSSVNNATRIAYNPCVGNPAAPVSPYYTCEQVGQEYLGDYRSLFVRPSSLGNGFHNPFVFRDRLYVIRSSPTPAILRFDPATFSRYDQNYNFIDTVPMVGGTMKVLLDLNDATSSYHAYLFSNLDGGSAVIIGIDLTNFDTTANWNYVYYDSTSFIDADFNADNTGFVILGQVGSTSNGVWNAPLPTSSAYAPTTPTPVALNAATCAGTAATIAYDPDAVRGNRVYVGCTGLLTTRGSIEALNPTSFANVNQTWLDEQDDLWSSWVHDRNTGIIYIGMQGRAATGGYSGILQYSTTDDRREGRVETPLPMNTVAMAMSTLKVPSTAQRAGAPYLYLVGQQTTSQFPSVSRWEAAQGCLDNCGDANVPARGTCVRRSCTCNAFTDPATGQVLSWQEPWCQTSTCPYNCNGNGVCNNMTCVCDRTWTTVDPHLPCLEPRCPNDCLGPTRGTCQRNATGYPEVCVCAPGWTGDDCSIKTFLPCNLLTANCSKCVENPACIWCSSSRTCAFGDATGPLAPLSQFECRSWYWGSCPSVGIPIVNYIMTAILGICVLISFISGGLIDTSSDNPERRTEWYLFQRAGKIWSMIYQCQLIAVAGLINFTYPTSFVGFLRYWNWILLAWGYPWHHSKGSQDVWWDTTANSGRTTKNWEQYMTYWKAETNTIFFTFLLWWGVALGIFIIFYIILLVVSIVRGGRTGFLAKTRPVYIALRMLEWGHLGVCVMGPLAIIKGGAVSAVIGGILWAILGVLAPIGLYVWLGFLKEKKELFKPTFAAAFYPFYGAFDFRYRMYIIVPWVKRILLGLLIGFIAGSNPLGQLIPITVVNLAYLIFVIIQRNMFSDYLQRYLEIILAVLNLVSFLFLFGFYGTPSNGVSDAMGIIFLVLQFLAMAISACFFLISWLQLNQVYSVVQCIKFCTCRGEK